MSWAVQWGGTRDLIWSRRFCYRVEGLGFVYIRSCARFFSLSLSLALSYSKCHRSASSFRNIDAMYKCWNKRTTSLKLGVIAIIEIEKGFSDILMGPAFYRNIFPTASLARRTRKTDLHFPRLFQAWSKYHKPAFSFPYPISPAPLALPCFIRGNTTERSFVVELPFTVRFLAYWLCDLNVWGQKLPCCLRFIIELISNSYKQRW